MNSEPRINQCFSCIAHMLLEQVIIQDNREMSLQFVVYGDRETSILKLIFVSKYLASRLPLRKVIHNCRQYSIALLSVVMDQKDVLKNYIVISRL